MGLIICRERRWVLLGSILLVFALACGWVFGPRADGHALLWRSVPDRGAVLQRAPDAVTLTFTEPPEPTFSVIHVLDINRHPMEPSPALVTVPGQPLALRLPLQGLPPGIYTVVWRTVSIIDGHVAGGAYEFGVGTAAAASSAEDTSPRPSALYAVSRLMLYVGVIGLMGTALAQIAARSHRQAGVPSSLWGLWILAAGGVALLGLGQASDAGTGLGRLLSTPLGGALLWRALPLVAAGAAIAMAQCSPRYRLSALLALSGLPALAMAAHVAAGHAAAGSGVGQWVAILAQWVHFGSIGVWAGALLALLATARTAPPDAAAARFCSLGAAGALGTAAVTGVLRTLEDVGSWPGLLSSEFGRLVLVKTGLFLLLALLGAGTRRLVLLRNVTRPRRLERVVAAEMILATSILAVTALMTGLAVPGATPSAQRTIQVPGNASIYSVALSDARTLTISLDPGGRGLNALHATFTDRTGRELDIARAPEVILGRTGETPRAIAVLQEGPGHFYADVELDHGDWQFSITVITRAGETLSAHLTIHL